MRGPTISLFSAPHCNHIVNGAEEIKHGEENGGTAEKREKREIKRERAKRRERHRKSLEKEEGGREKKKRTESERVAGR